MEGLDPVKEHLLIARYDPKRVALGEMMSLEDVRGILGIPILGIIPESPAVLAASNVGTPVILDGDAAAALAYADAVDRFLGVERPLRFLEPEKKRLFQRLFGS